jgi:very-short-patch-repair endonuclease
MLNHPDAHIDNSRHDTGSESGPCWQHISESLDLVLARLLAAYKIAPQCESPIEIILGAALIRLNELEHGGKALISSQYRFGRYRFDWALSFPELELPALFIECDGYAYHSTPEQLARDKAKDDSALQAGIEVLRFSGSDIFRHPDGCARVALSAAFLKA